MADEQILLPRERYQRLLKKINDKKPDAEVTVKNSTKEDKEQPEKVPDEKTGKRKKQGNGKTRRKGPPGIPAASIDWIRF